MEHATQQPAMDLRELVNRLHSENAKSHVIVAAVKRGNTVERDLLTFAIDSYLKVDEIYDSDYLSAGQYAMGIAQKAGWTERAEQIREYLIQECERRHHYMHAADFAKKGGQGQRANEILGRGVKELQKKGRYQEASVCASKLGQDDLAEKILREGLDACEKAGDEEGVRKLLFSLGESEKVREMDKRRKRSFKERWRDFWGEGHECGIDAVGLYIGFRGLSAADRALKFHLRPVANSIYCLTSKVCESRKDYPSAALFAEMAKKPERVKKMWEKEMNKQESDREVARAAYAAKKAGLEEKAHQLFVRATDDCESHIMFHDAIVYAEEAGLTDRIPTYKAVLKLDGEFEGELDEP